MQSHLDGPDTATRPYVDIDALPRGRAFDPKAPASSAIRPAVDAVAAQQEFEEIRSMIIANSSPPQMDSVPELIGLGPLFDLLRLVLYSARVIGERPVSVILIAPGGHGKTTLIERAAEFAGPFGYYTDDITSRELSKAMARDRVTHILLGDLMAMFGHKSHVVSLSVNVLRRSIEEGVDVDSFTGDRQSDGKRRIGLITAIPPADYRSKKVQDELKSGAFGERFMIVKYEYLPETRMRIHDFIASDAYTRERERLTAIDDRRMRVSIPPDLASMIFVFSQHLKQTDPLGARAHHHVRALVKASAIEQGRAVAELYDFHRVVHHSDFFTKDGKWL